MKKLILLLITIAWTKIVIGQTEGFYFTTSDSVKLYVRTAGTGNPCLFLHGGPGLTSFIFEATPAAKLLEKEVRMIYFDQRGSGRSALAKNGDYSIHRMEKDIEELRNHFKIKNWMVMGHSFGGILMTAYAKDFPTSIISLIYLHCTLNLNASLQSHIDNGIRLLKGVGYTYKLNTGLSKFDEMMKVHQQLAIKGIEYKIMFRSQQEMDIENALIDSTCKPFNQDFQHHVWDMKEYSVDFAQYSSSIRVPVLIITGNKDYAVGPDSYKTWKFLNKKVVIYNGAHTSYQEEPTWFACRVLQFVKAHQ
jgi:proline iminopeptidase